MRFDLCGTQCVYIIIFCLIILYSSFSRQTTSMPEMCEYILYSVLLKWKHENRRYFPLSALCFSGLFIFCIDILQTVTRLWCALLPFALCAPFPLLIVSHYYRWLTRVSTSAPPQHSDMSVRSILWVTPTWRTCTRSKSTCGGFNVLAHWCIFCMNY